MAGDNDISVRAAGLDDVAGIHAVHQSDVPAWRRLDGTSGQFEALSVLERYLNGGPWMSPETCAVYVNDLILAATPPIVAVRDGRIVGEMEILIGPDCDELGKTVCISILYVHREERGHGAGAALVKEAFRRGRALGCHSVETTEPEPDAIPFYRKMGLAQVAELIQVTVPLPPSDQALPSVRELQPLEALAELTPTDRLVIGRTRHPALIRQMLTQSAGTGRLAVPGTGGLVRAFALTLADGDYRVFFRGAPFRANGQSVAHVFGPRLTRDLVDAVADLAAAAGYTSVGLTVGADATGLIVGQGPRRSYPLYARYL